VAGGTGSVYRIRPLSSSLVVTLALAVAVGCAPSGQRVSPRRPSTFTASRSAAQPPQVDSTPPAGSPKGAASAPTQKAAKPKQATKPRKAASGPTAEQLRQAAWAYRDGAEAMSQNRLEVAAQRFEEGYRVAPKYRDIQARLLQAYLFLGMELYTEGNPEQAIQVWKKVLEIDPHNEKALAYIRKTQQELERIRELPGAKQP
jgi:hypothetical protein